LKYPDGKDPKNSSSHRTIVIDEKGTDLLRYVINEASEIKKTLVKYFIRMILFL
jgi:hypothetical protein